MRQLIGGDQEQILAVLPPDHHVFAPDLAREQRSEEPTSELQSLMRISYAVFCLKKKNTTYAVSRSTNQNLKLLQYTPDDTERTHSYNTLNRYNTKSM